MSSCILQPTQPRQLAQCPAETVADRLTQVAPIAYPLLAELSKSQPSVVLTGSVVAAAAGSAESSWDPSEWQESDLDVFCTGESTEMAVGLIRGLLLHARNCLWSHRGRVVEMTIGQTRVQIIHTGGSLPGSHLETPMDVLGTFDMTHLQVGLVEGDLIYHTRWTEVIETGVSEIISPDVLQRRVVKNLHRGYRLRFPMSIQARGLQGYDGSHWRVAAPLGVSAVEHLVGVGSYEYQAAPASPTLLSVWGQPDAVPTPVMHSWSTTDLQTPVTAWAWLQAHQLPRAAARLWWDLVLAICPRPERYRLQGTMSIGSRGVIDQPLSALRISDLPWVPSVSDLQVVEVPTGPTLSTITGYHGERLLCATMPSGSTQYYPLVQREAGGWEFRDATVYTLINDRIALRTDGLVMHRDDWERVQSHLANLD